MIREDVPRALKRQHVPFTLRAPVTLEVDFAMTIHADMAELARGYAHRRSHGRVYPSGLRGGIPGLADALESFSRD